MTLCDEKPSSLGRGSLDRVSELKQQREARLMARGGGRPPDIRDQDVRSLRVNELPGVTDNDLNCDDVQVHGLILTYRRSCRGESSGIAADRVGIPVYARVSHLTGGVIQWCASRMVMFMGIRLRRRRRPVSRLRVPRPTRVALVRSRNSAASEVTRRSRGCAATSGV